MTTETNFPEKPVSKGNIYAGLIIAAIGCLLLARQLDIFLLPHWLFQWPTILIVVGLFSGAKSNYQNVSWLIIVVTGLVFMVGKALPGFQVGHLAWPVVIIACGLYFITKRENQWKGKTPGNDWGNDWDKKWQQTNTEGYTTADADANSNASSYYSSEHALDLTVVFNHAKKAIISKEFKGGEIVNVFGNAEINFLQADIAGNPVIDLSLVFSKTVIIVPADWRVVNNSYTVFADFKDTRINNPNADPQKTLVLKGSLVFSQVVLVGL